MFGFGERVVGVRVERRGGEGNKRWGVVTVSGGGKRDPGMKTWGNNCSVGTLDRCGLEA